jgi:hypothetical protein
MGRKSEEKKVARISTNEVIEKTNNRNIKAPLILRKKNLIQRFGIPRNVLRKAPRISIPKNMSDEKKDRAEHRR